MVRIVGIWAVVGCAGGCGDDDDRDDRPVLVSHPYGPDGQQVGLWEVLSLSAGGALSATDTQIELGRATMGTVSFTPDGQIAISVHEDGTLGVVRFDEAGQPTVVHERFEAIAGAIGVAP